MPSLAKDILGYNYPIKDIFVSIWSPDTQNFQCSFLDADKISIYGLSSDTHIAIKSNLGQVLIIRKELAMEIPYIERYINTNIGKDLVSVDDGTTSSIMPKIFTVIFPIDIKIEDFKNFLKLPNIIITEYKTLDEKEKLFLKYFSPELYEKKIDFYKRYNICKNCHFVYHEDMNEPYSCNYTCKHISQT